MKQYIAMSGSKYLIFDEWESDMTGYGGSTETHITVKLTKDINKATIESKKILEGWLDYLSNRYNKKNYAVLREAKREITTRLVQTHFLI